MRRSISVLFLLLLTNLLGQAQTVTVRNPILEGFHPDPSICRVGEDYYLCNSSFTWYPGLPVYHSRDLMNWELIGHAIDRPGMISLDGVLDKDGVWAPTIRYHGGKFYIFCNVSNGGNFFITATDVKGPWSAPVFIKDGQGKKMPGIDPDIFWDGDGQSYAVGNAWGDDLKNDPEFKNSYFKDKSIAIWIQPIDLETGTLSGKRRYISAGCFTNSKNVEGAHLYRADLGNAKEKMSKKKYVLLIAEGGTDYYHAETLMTSDSIYGPYIPQKVNPVLSNRQLGHDAPIQSVGHADLVQTPTGEWYAVCLGKRMVDGYSFTRETFLCPVKIEDGEFIFNPGYGCMTETVQGRALCPPGTEYSCDTLPIREGARPSPASGRESLYYERIPHEKFEAWNGNAVAVKLLPQTIDFLASPALLLRKVSPMGFKASVKLSFTAKKANEQAGLVLHRNNRAYIALLKTKGALLLVTCANGKKDTLTTIPYKAKDVVMRLNVDGLKAVYSYGETSEALQPLQEISIVPLAESRPLNRFNGTGVGLYASANGKKSANKATFSGFEYEQ